MRTVFSLVTQGMNWVFYPLGIYFHDAIRINSTNLPYFPGMGSTSSRYVV